MDFASAAVGLARNDIDSPKERRRAEHSPGRALYNLDAFNLADVHGQVKGVVPRLRVADVNAVEQYGDVLARTSPDAYVRLCPYGTALADVHAHGILQQVIHTLRRRGGNLVASKHSYNPRHAASCQRCPRGRHVHFAQHDGAHRVCRPRAVKVCAHAHAVCLGVSQGGNAQRPYKHLAAKAREQGVTLAAEMLELEALALVENCFVHKINLVKKRPASCGTAAKIRKKGDTAT